MKGDQMDASKARIINAATRSDHSKVTVTRLVGRILKMQKLDLPGAIASELPYYMVVDAFGDVGHHCQAIAKCPLPGA